MRLISLILVTVLPFVLTQSNEFDDFDYLFQEENVSNSLLPSKPWIDSTTTTTTTTKTSETTTTTVPTTSSSTSTTTITSATTVPTTTNTTSTTPSTTTILSSSTTARTSQAIDEPEVGIDSKTEDVRATTRRTTKTTTTTASKTSAMDPEQKKDVQIQQVGGNSKSPSDKETTTTKIEDKRANNESKIEIGEGLAKNINSSERTVSTTTSRVTRTSTETTTIGLRATDSNGYNPKAASVSLTITPSLYRLIDEAFRNQFLDFEEKVIRIINKLLNDRKISEKEIQFLEADAFDEFTKIFEDPQNT